MLYAAKRGSKKKGLIIPLLSPALFKSGAVQAIKVVKTVQPKVEPKVDDASNITDKTNYTQTVSEPVAVNQYKTGSFSIKARLTQLKNPIENKEAFTDTARINYNDLPKKSFTELSLRNYLAEFTDKLKSEGKISLYNTLNSTPPNLEGSNVIININNVIQEKEISLIKQELVEYLRVKLENFDINVSTKINKIASGPNLYSNEDKYKRFVELNPALDSLRKKLNLDFD